MNNETHEVRKVIPIVPQEAEEVLISLYASHEKIYPRSVSGLFSSWRWGMVFLTQLVFYGLPWLEWGQRQAILFDLGSRRFYIFGLVLYPQDFIYLTGILVISALSLFLFTAVAGRLWCGYACPQTVYTEIFLWIEKKFEGDRSARMRRDAKPLSLDKVGRKTAKHLVWLAVALWTGFTFVGYFTPIKDLGLEFLQMSMSSWEVFWTFFYGFATYGNAGFMREQVCKHMCPYARFQSAMFDKDTLIVTYDEERGEPRGARSRKADITTLNLGACVDCSLCVQVCPTGIDIRKGLQYECIGCGACVDVCDTVMDKMGYARGLIKYTTENAMQQHWTQAQTLRHVLRPRVLVYTAILATIVMAMLVSLALRTPFKVNVVRDRGVMAREVAGGKIENVYRLQVMNATEAPQHYKITVSGLPGLVVTSEDVVMVASTEARVVPVRVQAPADVAAPGSHAMQFQIDALDSAGHLTEKSVFLVPR
ncbi:MAG: cytochrome c oxidase accessory protein CcoG [Rhodoferax sp.]|uniref:cytochrome c oxidase accessory protein CcoG n=1 Tax=Rhodoferax sp. TaxID=50421 RepID=UPI0017F3E354|nr:cytochrome c oxidase accessory protein CcoG [Rhodoferax sp.]NMM14344.1 cytochrome c oxidase accessory protein CcoG [Rhodoferax sp.]NMM18669.1 cytochrome c oxidase accessory protein CcoG [Rhodoferax sp.]